MCFLGFFFFFFFVFFVCGRGEKHVENQVKSKTKKKKNGLFGLKGAWAFYSLDTNFKAMALERPPPSNGL